jgi:hypothetical protein
VTFWVVAEAAFGIKWAHFVLWVEEDGEDQLKVLKGEVG